MDSTFYPFPFRDPVELDWLKVFDTLYCGDPRPADVPEMSFWRTLEIYSDHQVRRYQQAGVALNRIDSTSFMPGTTGTVYRRAFQEWKGSLILMLARGGWINTTYGNLELMSAGDVRWFARVQSLFFHLQAEGHIDSFGGIPGDTETYGFGAVEGSGSVYVVVNPSQAMATILLPLLARQQPALEGGHLLFRDAALHAGTHGEQHQVGTGTDGRGGDLANMPRRCGILACSKIRDPKIDPAHSSYISRCVTKYYRGDGGCAGRRRSAPGDATARSGWQPVPHHGR